MTAPRFCGLKYRDGDESHRRLKRALEPVACRSRQPARDTSGRGPREAAARRPPRRRVVECPNRTPAIGTAMARVDEFRTAKLRRGSPNVCPRPGCGEVIKDYYHFPMGSDF